MGSNVVPDEGIVLNGGTLSGYGTDEEYTFSFTKQAQRGRLSDCFVPGWGIVPGEGIVLGGGTMSGAGVICFLPPHEGCLSSNFNQAQNGQLAGTGGAQTFESKESR